MATMTSSIAFHAPDLPDVDGFLEDARRILSSGRLGRGPFGAELERQASALLGGGSTIAVTNCSNGLIAALASVRPDGDERGEAIVPSFTYLATWQAAVWAGYEPVVADVDSNGLLDPVAVRAALTPRTRVIVGVHLLGQPADLVGLRAVASEAGVPLVFDSAHALGARWTDRPVGSGGDIEVFSLGPTKQIGGSDGGLIVVNRPALVPKVRLFVDQGHVLGELDAVGRGLNIGISELSAALILRALPDLDRRIERRAAIHDRYEAAWQDLPLRLSRARPGERHAFKDEIVWLDVAADRDRLHGHLRADQIETRTYYDPAIPDLTAFEGRVASARVGRDLATRGLALPIHGRMDDDDVDRVVRSVQRFWS